MVHIRQFSMLHITQGPCPVDWEQREAKEQQKLVASSERQVRQLKSQTSKIGSQMSLLAGNKSCHLILYYIIFICNIGLRLHRHVPA